MPAEGQLDYEMKVELGKVMEFARAAKSSQPAYGDEAGVIHPTFLTVGRLQWEPRGADPVGSLGFDPSRMLHGEEEFVFHGPMPRPGDSLRVSTYVAQRWEKAGRRGGRMRFALVVNEFRRDDGSLAAEQKSTIIETSGPEAQ